MARMRAGRRDTVVAVAALVLLFASCVAPLYEHASIKRGPCLTAGIGVASFEATSEPVLLGIGTIRADYGIGRPDRAGNVDHAILVQASYGIEMGPDEVSFFPPRWPSIQAGWKHRLSDHTALRLTVGVPSFVDVLFVQDMGRYVTGSLGVGCSGLTGGLTGHLSLPGGWTVHPSLSATVHPEIDEDAILPGPGEHVRASLYAGIGVETP